MSKKTIRTKINCILNFTKNSNQQFFKLLGMISNLIFHNVLTNQKTPIVLDNILKFEKEEMHFNWSLNQNVFTEVALNCYC